MYWSYRCTIGKISTNKNDNYSAANGCAYGKRSYGTVSCRLLGPETAVGDRNELTSNDNFSAYMNKTFFTNEWTFLVLYRGMLFHTPVWLQHYWCIAYLVCICSRSNTLWLPAVQLGIFSVFHEHEVTCTRTSTTSTTTSAVLTSERGERCTALTTAEVLLNYDYYCWNEYILLPTADGSSSWYR